MEASPGTGESTPRGPCKRPSDFSIEHILRRAGRKEVAEEHPVGARFQWLQCTRYHPPKLPRSRRKETTERGRPGKAADGAGGGRRKAGRNPRIPFSSGQVSALESRFRRAHYLSGADVAALSTVLGLSEARVKIWFQNRRARERRDRETARAAGGPSPAPEERTAADHSPEIRVGGLVSRPAWPPSPFPGIQSAFVPFPRSQPPPLPDTPPPLHRPCTTGCPRGATA